MKIRTDVNISRNNDEPIRARDVIREIGEVKGVLADCPVLWGKGSPEDIVFAKIGTLYLRLDGSTSTTLYIKESGDPSKDGWIAK